jgi:hypothetical protein
MPGVFIILAAFIVVNYLFVEKRHQRIHIYTILVLGGSFLAFAKSSLFGGQPASFFENFSLVPFAKSLLGSLGLALVPSKNMLINFLIVAFFLLLWKKRSLLSTGRGISPVLYLHLLSIFLISLQIIQKGNNFTTFGLIGIYFAAAFLQFGFKEYLSKDFQSLKTTTLIFFLSFASMVIPLIRIPQIHATSEHRYLIYSALVIPLVIVNGIEKILREKSIYRLLVVGLGLMAAGILVVNFWGQSKNYLEVQNKYHGASYTENVWAQIHEGLKGTDLKNEKIGVILLTKNEYEAKVYNSIYFGFGYHAGLLYSVWDEQLIPPSWLITDGPIDKSLIPPHVISPDRKILVFEILEDKVTQKDIKF